MIKLDGIELMKKLSRDSMELVLFINHTGSVSKTKFNTKKLVRTLELNFILKIFGYFIGYLIKKAS